MVSIDVVSLLTGIPLKKPNNFAVSYITGVNTNKLPKTDVTQLFSIATSQTHFLLNGKVYDQNIYGYELTAFTYVI